MKIIHIPPSERKSNLKLSFEELHYASWATNFAKKTLEYDNKYQIEIWKTYDPLQYGDQGISKRNKDGILFIQFPAKKIGPKFISYSLLEHLDYTIKSKEQILIHQQSVHDIMPYLISFKCRNIPLIAQQRAPTSPPIIKFQARRHPGYLLMHILDNLSLNYYDNIIAPSVGEYKYLKSKIGDKAVFLKGGGIDFESIQINSKSEVRKELNLPLDKKILIHVGRFNKLKGVDAILDVYNSLSKIRDDLLMIFIGGNKNDPLYGDIIHSGAVTLCYTPKNIVMKYLNASDIYLLPTENKAWIPFADIGTSQIESLALNVPNISPLLMHFSGTEEEREKLGIMTNNRAEVIDAITCILNNPDKYTNTRPIMKKYYDWEIIIHKNIQIYDALFDKYYG